jgi:thymidylate synthase ThyX
MLVLTRHVNQSVIITIGGHEVKVVLLDTPRDGKARLGFEADESVKCIGKNSTHRSNRREQVAYKAEIVLDSISTAGHRLTTMLCQWPARIHWDFLMHRAFSRSVSSTRAIPAKTMIKWVSEDPFIPIHFGKNQKGMQSSIEPVADEEGAREDWLDGLHHAVESAQRLHQRGCHKQIVNAKLMQYMWMNVVFSGTDDAWANFFNLRCHEAEAPEVQKQAVLMMRAYDASEPVERVCHLPFITEEEELGAIGDHIELAKMSAARCARTSYLTTEGKPPTRQEDLQLYERLVGSDPKHANPLEHPARSLSHATSKGNFVGWEQYRHQISGESATRKTFDIKDRLALYEGRDFILPA